MEKGKFIFDATVFENEVVQKMKTISEEMDATYKEAMDIMKNDIESYKGWQGKQKEELLAFLDLMTQFHKDLSVGDTSPTDTFYATIADFPKAVNTYNEDSKSYKNLKGVWK